MHPDVFTVGWRSREGSPNRSSCLQRGSHRQSSSASDSPTESIGSVSLSRPGSAATPTPAVASAQLPKGNSDVAEENIAEGTPISSLRLLPDDPGASSVAKLSSQPAEPFAEEEGPMMGPSPEPKETLGSAAVENQSAGSAGERGSQKGAQSRDDSDVEHLFKDQSAAAHADGSSGAPTVAANHAAAQQHDSAAGTEDWQEPKPAEASFMFTPVPLVDRPNMRDHRIDAALAQQVTGQGSASTAEAQLAYVNAHEAFMYTPVPLVDRIPSLDPNQAPHSPPFAIRRSAEPSLQQALAAQVTGRNPGAAADEDDAYGFDTPVSRAQEHACASLAATPAPLTCKNGAGPECTPAFETDFTPAMRTCRPASADSWQQQGSYPSRTPASERPSSARSYFGPMQTPTLADLTGRAQQSEPCSVTPQSMGKVLAPGRGNAGSCSQLSSPWMDSEAPTHLSGSSRECSSAGSSTAENFEGDEVDLWL